MPTLRAEPADFEVEELALYPPTGEGGHTLLWIEKQGIDTEEVARELERLVGARTGEVGFAGRKDRVAIARQWFSVPGLDASAALALDLLGGSVRGAGDGAAVRVIEAHRHRHKLRLGELAGNRFRLRVRDVTPAQAAAAAERWPALGARGFANRFGHQRFGRAGDNAARGAALLRSKARVRDRRSSRFLVSALQAAVFNRVLEERALPIDQLRAGDVAIVHASGGLLRISDPDAERSRVGAFEVSPTGPLFGSKMLEPRGDTQLEEARALAAFELPPPSELRLPRGLELSGARRALRGRVREAALERIEDGLELRFVLDPGSYATVLVEELFLGEPVRDAARYRSVSM